ncbi:HNH endonuclease [Paenibacillus daejeonensis]|uniref:HNH endonuclease n=1 Tax=Paenibacillus daejeonensis TaxID=135193 RepID=UPI0003744572|nr:HNH endonuclease [Paenibacillus daejeonensis]
MTQMTNQSNHDTETSVQESLHKLCVSCGQSKPVGEFLRRTGKRSRQGARRGTCRECRKTQGDLQVSGDEPIWEPAGPTDTDPSESVDTGIEQSPRKPRKRKRKRRSKASPPAPAVVEVARVKPVTSKKKLPQHASLMQVETPDVSGLRTTRRGIVWMRGRTEKGRRWHQETDLETAQTLVREHAAVILNPYTVQRLYSNKTFRSYILNRDHYTCYFCGEYGDTIDHLLPRAKGGHTTPLNCVCACNLCNQSKADRDMDEFIQNYVPPVSESE